METGGTAMVRFSTGILFGTVIGMSVAMLDKRMLKQAKKTVKSVMKNMCI